MGNTSVNITLQSKSDPTINIQTIDGGSVNSSPNFIPTINFVATGPVGAQGAQGTQGADGSGGSTLTDDSVQTSHIINGAVTGAKIANYSITASKLSGSAVSTTKLQNLSVTTAKLADNSVTAAKIANGAITNELIDVFADFAIKKEKIEYLGLDASVIALDAIITSKIKDRNVTGAKIESNPDLDGEVKAHNLKLKGSSPATLTGPDSDALQIKSNTTIDFLNTSGTTIASLDQSGNLTILGTIDNRNISTDGSKLDTISNNAQPNVKSNWNETDSNSDAFIQNKPTIPVNTDTTYNIQCVDGDNSNEQKIRLAASGSGSGDDDVVLEAGTGLSISRSGDKITFTNTVVDTDTVLTAEQVQDIVGAMIDGGTETNISVTYDDTSGKLNFVSTDTNTTYSVMGSGNSYAAGLVPEGDSSHGAQFLRKDGTWVTPPDTNTTYVEATSQYMGLMSSAHHDKLDGIASGAEVNVQSDWDETDNTSDAYIQNKPTIPAAYTDAEAVSAVAAADNYLRNDAGDIMNGSLEINDYLFINKLGGGSKIRFRNNSTTSNRTLDVPDYDGVLATTNKLIDTKTAAYWSNSTAGFYITLSGASTSENTSLSTASYTLMYVAPFDGKIKRISSFHQSSTSGTSTFEMYIDGDDSDLTNDQRGSDMTTSAFTRKFTEDCPADWTFSKGEAIAIKRTDSTARYGVTMTIVFEYDTTT